jgi:uncharacterized LabA/DUF88 family protein
MVRIEQARDRTSETSIASGIETRVDTVLRTHCQNTSSLSSRVVAEPDPERRLEHRVVVRL